MNLNILHATFVEMREIKGKGAAQRRQDAFKACYDQLGYDMLKYVSKTLDSRICLYVSAPAGRPSNSITMQQAKKQAAAMIDKYAEGDTSLLGVMDATIGAASEGATRGDKGQNLLWGLFESITDEADHGVLEDLWLWFILREMRIGFGVKSINALFVTPVVFYNPYQRSEGNKPAYQDALDWERGVIAQLKYDGQFGEARMCPVNPTLTTRAGSLIDTPSTRDIFDDLRALQTHMSIVSSSEEPPIFMGETLVVTPSGEIMSRSKGNGLINSMLQTGEPLPQGHTLKYRVWTYVYDAEKEQSKSVDDAIGDEYEYVWGELLDGFKSAQESGALLGAIELAEYKVINTPDQAADYFKEALKRGEEGLILKCPSLTWHDGNSTKSLKMKLEMDVDLRIIGLNPADPNGKYADTFGSLECESACGMLRVGVHGITDDDRKYIFENQDEAIGSIIAVRSNGVEFNENADGNSEFHSLFLPRKVSELRKDKDEADTFEQVLEQERTAIQNGGKSLKVKAKK